MVVVGLVDGASLRGVDGTTKDCAVHQVRSDVRLALIKSEMKDRVGLHEKVEVLVQETREPFSRVRGVGIVSIIVDIRCEKDVLGNTIVGYVIGERVGVLDVLDPVRVVADAVERDEGLVLAVVGTAACAGVVGRWESFGVRTPGDTGIVQTVCDGRRVQVHVRIAGDAV